MAVTYGFYNSLNKDRMYNAEQMSSIFNGIITDGVFSTIGDALMTVAGTGMQVIVKPGRAWFNSTWTLNDAQLPLDVPAADVSLTRIDAVILEVNSAVATRANSIKILKGTPSANPAKPTLSATETLHQYALAYITIAAGVTSITAANIEINVGKAACPFITSVLQQTDITDLFNQWEAEFTAWFENVQSQLSGDVAANLQRQIDDLKVATGSKITDSTAATIGVAQDTTVDAAIDALGVAIDMMKLNMGYLTLTIKDTSGNPISGIPISIIIDKNGNVQSSDSNGIVKGYVFEGTQTISISGYADLTDYSDTITIVKGNFHTKEISLTIINFLKITSSQSLKFSEAVSTIDVNCIGGGGASGNGYASRSSQNDTSSGGGGGGGHSVIQTGVSIISGQSYQAIVGSGGASVGANGGTSSFLGVSASGGNGGGAASSSSPYYGSGGAGNGAGARGVRYYTDNTGLIYAIGKPGNAGTEIGYKSYTETELTGGGGGSGGCGDTASGNIAGGNGGSPGGGNGAGRSGYGGGAGISGIGGGGGSGYAYYSNSEDGSSYDVSSFGKGGSGSIRIRIHFKTASLKGGAHI